MAYVYRHIRLDKNEPFYIGVGEDSPNEIGKYRRAYNVHNRSKHWKDICAKSKVEVEILMDDLTYEKAYEKEIEFIKLYGRVNLKTGTLCNKTDGGPGMKMPVLSSETLKKKKDCQKHRKIAIVQKDFDGNVIKIWEDVKSATFAMNGKSTSSIRYCLNGKYLHAYGFKWEYLDQEKSKKVVKTFKDRPRIVQMNLNGEVVKIWDWLEQAKKEGFRHISKCCKKNKMYKTCGGYKWEYFDDKKQYIFSDNLYWKKK
jgi:hypothetical protein